MTYILRTHRQHLALNEDERALASVAERECEGNLVVEDTGPALWVASCSEFPLCRFECSMRNPSRGGREEMDW